MARFYLSARNLAGNRFVLTGAEAHHAATVLRIQPGDYIDLFDGENMAFVGRVETVRDENIEGVITESRPSPRLPISVTVYQALMKGSKWDWFLEKVCEIGAQRVVPIISKRCIARWSPEETSKLERWRRIALSASKQSGRTNLMEVTEPVSLQSAFNTRSESLSIMPWEKETERSIKEVCQTKSWPSVGLYIGPEGGWDPEEVLNAQQCGILPVRLGPTLLRTETAGIVATLLVLREANVY